MPAKREWTADEIERLRRLVGQRMRTVDLARHYHVSPQYMRKVVSGIGFHSVGRGENAHWADKAESPKVADHTREQNWWPLPAGHPVPWQAITRGTCLEGAPYQPW